MRVVIVGGGFGGVRLALNLAKKKGFEVKLISDKSYFEYHAALYRSATGRSPLEAAIPLTDFFEYAPNVEIIKDRIVAVNVASRTVSGSSDYRYDTLVLAVGSVTQYFGVKGLAEYSYGVKTINEALELKRHLHDDLLLGVKERNYVVVGAGASGVELAAELTTYLKRVRRNHGIKQVCSIDLIEASPRALALLPERFAHKVERRLKELGVKLYLNTAVNAETLEAIELPRGEIKSQTVVWTAGVANNPLFAAYPATLKAGKVVVNEFLETEPGVYVIGDSALTAYSGMAQTALHDANFVSADLQRQNRGKARKSYQPKRPTYAIPVGSKWSAVLWGKIEVYGYMGWVLRRLADLRLFMNFLPLRKALAVWRYGATAEEICPKCR